jgi:hypothetical protein
MTEFAELFSKKKLTINPVYPVILSKVFEILRLAQKFFRILENNFFNRGV